MNSPSINCNRFYWTDFAYQFPTLILTMNLVQSTFMYLLQSLQTGSTPVGPDFRPTGGHTGMSGPAPPPKPTFPAYSGAATVGRDSGGSPSMGGGGGHSAAIIKKPESSSGMTVKLIHPDEDISLVSAKFRFNRAVSLYIFDKTIFKFWNIFLYFILYIFHMLLSFLLQLLKVDIKYDKIFLNCLKMESIDYSILSLCHLT